MVSQRNLNKKTKKKREKRERKERKQQIFVNLRLFSMMSGKRKALSLSDKKKLLDDYEKLRPISISEAATALGIARTSLGKLIRDEEMIRNSCGDGERKRKRSGKDPAVDEAMVQWISASREKNAPLSGPLVMQKAEEMAKKMGKETFKATNGWFERFKKREGLKTKKLHGEGQAADIAAQEDWLIHTWPNLRERFKDEDIFNADESGIYIRALPDYTLTFKSDNKKGGKKAKKESLPCFVDL